MAARGTIMTNFHAAAPTCTPTRASILTGLYPWRLGIKAVFEYGEKGKSNRDDFLALVPTIAMIFRENNYTTGHYGKWHVGGMRNDDLNMRLLPNKRCHHPGPNQQGFDDYVSILDGPGAIRQNELQVNSLLYSEGCNYLLNNDSKSVNPLEPFKSEYLFECEVRHAIEKMSESVNNNKPFFIQVWFHAPHGPWQTISEFQEPYFIIQRLKIRDCLSSFTQKECNRKFPPLFRQPHSQMDKYKTMVTGMDNSVGVLLRSLKTLGIEKDTIVVFLSDNGPEDDVGTTNQPRNTTSGLRGNKRFLYEGGIRVPCIWQWVGKIPKGKESTVLGISTDILPTVLDAASIPLPKNLKIDGISLLPELLSHHTRHHVKSLSKMKSTKRQYFERMGMWHTAYESPRATVGILFDFKIILNVNDHPVEIYDLYNDKNETRNLLPNLINLSNTTILSWRNYSNEYNFTLDDVYEKLSPNRKSAWLHKFIVSKTYEYLYDFANYANYAYNEYMKLNQGRVYQPTHESDTRYIFGNIYKKITKEHADKIRIKTIVNGVCTTPCPCDTPYSYEVPTLPFHLTPTKFQYINPHGFLNGTKVLFGDI